MKLIKKVLVATLVLTIIFSGTVIGTKLTTSEDVKASEEENDKSTISVTGKGAIKVSPDMAYVTLGVQTQDKNANKAQKENSKLMNKVIEEIKSLGISEKDIKTSNFNIRPEYIHDKEDDGGRKINKYSVSHNIEIIIRDIDKVGNVIDKAVENGVNMSNSIRFSISNPDEVYQDALVEAIKNAKGKADVIADALNVDITTPKNVTEQGSYSIPYSYNDSYERSMDEVKSMPVETGELEVTANVNVIYEY